MKARHPDVLVVGAGAIGCSIAWELAKRGVSVTVVERDTPGRGATWAAAGMLSPLGESPKSDSLLKLASTSLDLWPDFARQLHEHTQIDVDYRTTGALHVALAPDHVAMLHDFARRGTEHGTLVLQPDEARAMEPCLTSTIQAAVFVARDHSVHTRRLGMALWSACTGAGVTFCTGVPPAELLYRKGRFDGIRLDDGRFLSASAVVVAAGAWSSLIAGLPRPLPVRPVRGQMFSVNASNTTIQHTIVGPGCYLVPRESTHILVGATVEDVGFEPGPTPGGIAQLIEAAAGIVPRITELPLLEAWAGFRPGTPDDLPILGGDPEIAGVYYATGHFRNGILLAPFTSQLTADLLTGAAPALSLEPFGMARFSGA